MQSVSSRIWTHVAVSISYDDNHYTTSTLFDVLKYHYDLLIIQLNISHFLDTVKWSNNFITILECQFLYTVKWFQAFLSNINNSI